MVSVVLFVFSSGQVTMMALLAREETRLEDELGVCVCVCVRACVCACVCVCVRSVSGACVSQAGGTSGASGVARG